MICKRILSIVLMILLFGFSGYSNAQSPAEGEVSPDIPGWKKSVWHCDEGATVASAYTNIKSNEWRRTIIMTQLRPYATESRSGGQTHYFVLSQDGTKFLEISFEQFKSDMWFLSPNYVKHLRDEPNDCVDSRSLQPEHR